MMNMESKEERAQSREICEAAKIRNSNLINVPFSESALVFHEHARTALPAALDYIEQLERQVKIALKTCPNGGNDGYITPRPCQCEVEAIETDRDHQKARAEKAESEIAILRARIERLEVSLERTLYGRHDYV